DRILENTLYLKIMVWAIFLPFIANSTGWIMTEMGRQPFVVFGLMKTEDAVSPSVTVGEMLFSLIAFNLLYEILVFIAFYLFVGFFVLEGFDFGVGTVAKFLGKDDVERRVYISAIGPYWDANEVWLITAGGAMFAAFPHWYATMFSGFYIPLVFMLIVLILRGVGFEFRGQLENMKWRKTWDWSIFVGSAIPPILWGVVLANFMIGMPIDADMEMQSGFLFFLNPFA